MIKLPPDLAALRALVREALEPADRTALSRWLVLHADEAIASALDALAIEWREIQRDARLPNDVRVLSEAFWAAFEVGLADIDPEPIVSMPALLLSAPPRQLPRDELTVEFVSRRDRVVRVRDLGVSPASVLIAANDRGALHALDVANARYRCDLDEGRITFWWLRERPVELTHSALIEAVRRETADGAARAMRVTEALFDE